MIGGIAINGLHHIFLQHDDRRGSKSERMVEQSSSVDQQSAFVNIPHQIISRVGLLFIDSDNQGQQPDIPRTYPVKRRYDATHRVCQ